MHLKPLSAPGGKLSVARAVDIACDIAKGLMELHAKGVAMLDLKPDNVLLTNIGTAVLTDFGISRVVATTVGAVQQTQVAGTYNYM